jgi:hypothetical protein
VISVLQVELRALRASDPGMGMFTAVEYITSDPGRRVALYKLCNVEARDIRFNGMSQDDSCPLKIASSVDKDLAFLQRRAAAEGFRFRWNGGRSVGRVQDGIGYGPLPVTCPTARLRRQ